LSPNFAPSTIPQFPSDCVSPLNTFIIDVIAIDEPMDCFIVWLGLYNAGSSSLEIIKLICFCLGVIMGIDSIFLLSNNPYTLNLVKVFYLIKSLFIFVNARS